MKTLLAAVLATAASLVAPLSAQGSEAYPDKPITIVAPYPPGGATDLIARSVAESLQKAWGQPVVVDNRPGHSGMIGASQVARSKPDGYTLLVGSQALYSVNPLLYSDMLYDAENDFTTIAQLALLPSFFVVPADFPADNFQEFVQYVKDRPGELAYGSAGTGTAQHIFMEMLNNATGMDMTHVPYKGSSPAVTDLVGGRVVAMIDFGPSILSFVDTGRLKALAVSTEERSPRLPDVPTLQEQGVEGFDASTWFAIHGPAGMDPTITEKISAEVAKAVQQQELKSILNNMGIESYPSSPEELKNKQAEELVKWKKVIDSAAISIEQ